MHHSRGFSLVELMVALLIGLVIILGAGSCFSRGSEFQKVERVEDKQAALMFAADVLIRDIRRADSIEATTREKRVNADHPGRWNDAKILPG
ncbi:prepilin-type N-terminal cleavage/methylation domain-containing protein [Billgrantia gudaonensis]|uniref:Prepilin-type N-terminal cleavage/methylation domain-containing protein n=1 Tax=Billgrantia gudaonensis TaxID=376427 RepID=A0A3S0QG85_9GAMM|nr:prepilin-type N-terminal cleavage/methylation domain-containing protein [Halomonas gudaonensis]